MPRTIEAMAFHAFKEGRADDLTAFAKAQIDHRGLRPQIEKINAQLARAFAPKRDEAA